MTEDTLPSPDQAGEFGTWKITNTQGHETFLEGDFLGMGSTHREEHTHVGPPDIRHSQGCQGCRWVEVYIFQADEGDYLIVKTGRSRVPGETDRTTFGYLKKAAQVVRTLQGHPLDSQAFTFVARRALETASDYDDDLNEAYEAALARGVGS